MNIVVFIQDNIIEEFKQKFNTAEHTFTFFDGIEDASVACQGADLVFDFISDNTFGLLRQYAANQDLVVFYNSTKTSLTEIHAYNLGIEATLIGFNGLPTFINRPLLEVTVLEDEHKTVVENICALLNTKYTIVADRVGMVSPRILCMIINEAYYTLQEGTAGEEDIDTGMKLGTNYPMGPFEWSRKIGIEHVYELLEAVYNDTKDERYKICPLLKQQYLKALIV